MIQLLIKDTRSIKEKLKDLIHEQINQSFVDEYQDKAKDTEAVGIMVSQYFDWDGRRIVEAFCEALTDANFHDFSAKVEEEFEKSMF